MAVPGVETVGFTEQGPWQLPERTVLVKTFSLDLADGSRRRVETRFLTRQQGEWFGYSYAWNDEQTEAFLVEAKGLDRPYTIQTPAGERKQVWHYPSRSECLACHSRAANYVLGLSMLQMNKSHEYGTCTENQLSALQHAGLLRGGTPLTDERRRRHVSVDGVARATSTDRGAAL